MMTKLDQPKPTSAWPGTTELSQKEMTTTRSLTAYSTPPSTSTSTSTTTPPPPPPPPPLSPLRSTKFSTNTNLPPAILPKLSAKLPSRFKRTQPPTTTSLSPSPSFKQTLHASLSQDGLDSGQRRLNQYLLIKTIGRGSFGSVELAQDTTNPHHRSLYAIKEYSKSRMRKRARILNHRSKIFSSRTPTPNPSILSESSEGILLVKEEVAIMKKLSHPNIVSLLEVIDTDQDSLFFVLELCPYGPVMQIQANESTAGLSESSARNVFRQMILGIEYLHFNQVIHRDIKPDNILYFDDPHLRPDPLCKIVDFGVSESFAKPGDDTMHKSAGSPAFLAPEVCMGIGEGVHGRIADIWAMGITLYALVCGKLPFEGFNQIALCDKIMNESPVFPDHLSGSLVELLRCLLDKAPQKRIQMDKLRVARWVTEEGTKPLETQASDLTPIEPPTEREIADAFKSLKTIATMFKAIGKFRAKRRSRTSQATDDPSESMTSSPSASCSRSDTPSSYTDQLVDSPLSSVHTISPRPRAPSFRTRTAPELASPLRKLTFDVPELSPNDHPLSFDHSLLPSPHLPSLHQAFSSFQISPPSASIPSTRPDLPPSSDRTNTHPDHDSLHTSTLLSHSPDPSHSPILFRSSPSSSPPSSNSLPLP